MRHLPIKENDKLTESHEITRSKDPKSNDGE